MAKDPAFLLYYKDFLVSCSDWDADVFGWYMRLICHQADKPEGLPNDIERLANLAGVKFSQFERFNDCWQRTLSAKFKTNASGLLYNEQQEQVLTERKEYTSKQSIRGIVGAFLKKNRAQYNFSEEAWKIATRQIISTFNIEAYHSKGESYIHSLLQAYASNIIVNVDADVNADVVEDKEGVQGEIVSHVTKESECKTDGIDIPDTWFRQFFDDIYMESQKINFQLINVEDQYEKFKIKVRGAPQDYIHRDTSGMRLAFQYQLRQAKPERKHYDKSRSTISNRETPPTTFGTL